MDLVRKVRGRVRTVRGRVRTARGRVRSVRSHIVEHERTCLIVPFLFCLRLRAYWRGGRTRDDRTQMRFRR